MFFATVNLKPQTIMFRNGRGSEKMPKSNHRTTITNAANRDSHDCWTKDA